MNVIQNLFKEFGINSLEEFNFKNIKNAFKELYSLIEEIIFVDMQRPEVRSFAYFVTTSIFSAIAIIFSIHFTVLYFRGTFLKADKFKQAQLISKHELTNNTFYYRFALGFPKQKLGLPIGKHVSLRCLNDQGKQVIRSYTPVTDDDLLGYVDFVIKTYPEGQLTQYISKLKPKDYIDMKGPKGRFEYEVNMVDKLGMIAGGTGITPMYQVAQHIFKNKKDKTQIKLIFGNVTEDDIFLEDWLVELQEQDSQRFQVHYILDKPPKDWTGGVGYVNKDMIKEHLPGPDESCKILVCGPPPMVRSSEKQLVELGYRQDQIFTF